MSYDIQSRRRSRSRTPSRSSSSSRTRRRCSRSHSPSELPPFMAGVSLEPVEQPLGPDTIDLESIKDGKITGVSVYSARAEVTRQFNVNVKAGINQVVVRGLPQVMDKDSFRVEGRGAATIHDVALSCMNPPRAQMSSEALEQLQILKQRLVNSIERTKRSTRANDAYLSKSSANSQHIDPKRLSDIFETYESASMEFDDRMIELETQKKNIERQIQVETGNLRAETGTYNEKLNMRASISVFADVEGEIQIVLVYAVWNASWKAGYDIRVDMQTKGKPIQVAYKGAITQNTGEDWSDVPLILETANPTFGLTVPSLDKWTLSVKKPIIQPSRRTSTYVSSHAMPMTQAMIIQQPMIPTMSMSISEPMQHRGASVSSKGTVSATFSVPGLITIPSDGYSHNVTITALFLESMMSWLCVPKKDNKTHLKAKIKNASEYTLLAGSANVYVDGSFISKTSVPLVSPDETFDCPLGLDSSVRVTYHALSKKETKSGFYTKSTNYVYQQRITIFNTKTHAIDRFKVLDQFPVSEDSNITVKHVNPALVVPSSIESANTGAASSSTPGNSNTISVKGITPVKVAEGVVAQWDGADEVESGDVPIDTVGKDGKLAWICSIPAGSKLGLVLHYEVTTPVKTEVNGL